MSADGVAKSQLVQSDIDAFLSLPTDKLVAFDQQNGGVFTAVFGGTTGADVSHYFKTRIQLVATDPKNLLASLDINSLPYTAWMGKGDGGGGTSALLAATTQARLAGLNIGTTLWFTSLINRVSFNIIYFEQILPVNSSRVGIMELGPAYEAKAEPEFGGDAVPVGVRQGILIHEARHSDCTGGITEADLDVARSAQNDRDFFQRFPKPECGHFHSICPASMPGVGGLAACDDRPWGAYMVGYLYEKALISTVPVFSDEWSQITESAEDSYSRLLFDNKDDILQGKGVAPDMSSDGLQ